MEKEGLLKEFIDKRPKSEGVFGYGSKVFEQLGYDSKTKAQYDLIFIVDNIKKWHQENYSKNPKDYSLIGKTVLTTDTVEKLKGNTGMTYQSNIKENDAVFKYGVIEKDQFVENVTTWKSLYVTGRFQKPVLPIVTTEKINDAIETNRRHALLVSLLLLEYDKSTLDKLYEKICSLSYIGDTRMKVAENPDKVKNIVGASYDFFTEYYGKENKYFNINDNGTIERNDINLLEDINTLPSHLNQYLELSNCNKEDLVMLREEILNFLSIINGKESKEQTIKGIVTNGVVRSVKYVIPKVMKKIKSL